MERDKDIRKELEEISPLLSKLEKPKEQLPPGYLDKNRRAIMQRIHEEKSDRPFSGKILSLFANPRFHVPVGIAASILLAIFIWTNIGPKGQDESPSLSFEDIGREEALAYVEDNLYQFDEAHFAAALDEEDLDEWMNELIMEEMAGEEALETPSYELFNDAYYEDLF